jgi:hypothetical protein
MEKGSAASRSRASLKEASMLSISSTDLAIALADKAGTLQLVERESRFGLGTYVSLEDTHGVIEVQLSWAEAQARVAQVRGAVR